MVGPLKSLLDLRSIQANIEVTCRTCRATKLIDREEAIEGRLLARDTLDWQAFLSTLVCPAAHCPSTDLKVETPAFCDDAIELRRRRQEVTIINLALKALSEACYNRPPEAERGAVRLALRVLHHHAHIPPAMLTDLWTQLCDEEQTAWNLSHQHLRWITKALLDKRVPVWAELR